METLRDRVTGFTSNPTLCRQAGVTDYAEWIRQAVERFPEYALSVEVVADDFDEMADQAMVISEYGDSVRDSIYVKIPVMTCGGSETFDLISGLSQDDVRVNVTAVMTVRQVENAISALESSRGGIVSVFAGRIADTGIDPAPLIDFVEYRPDNVELLWASVREPLNITQAAAHGWDIITVPPMILAKYDALTNFDLLEFSRNTVIQFRDDALAAGLSL
jgi:transaldolase